MKKIILPLLLLLFVIGISCKKDKLENKYSYTYFNAHLKADMKYDDYFKIWGTPNEDKGSGIHIYVYNLTDGTFIYIGYTDHIMYARHVDANMQILHTIV